MNFVATGIEGVVLIESERHVDERGSFRRAWCKRAFEEANLPSPMVQISLSETERRGTLRGLHFQGPPSHEAKLVQCVTGRIFDVALDLRPDSPTFLQHFGTELSREAGSALLIPAGCAHGFLTLSDDCTALYMMTDYYAPELARGVRWNDPAFSIQWPAEPSEILERDANYPDFDMSIVARDSSDSLPRP